MSNIFIVMLVAVIARLTVWSGESSVKRGGFASAVQYSIPLIFIMASSAALYGVVREYLLASFSLWHTETFFFVLIACISTYLIAFVLGKLMPKAYGRYDCITAVFATLGLLAVLGKMELSLLYGVIMSLGAAAVFFVLYALLSYIKDRLELADVPKSFRGVPILLIIAGIILIVLQEIA